MNRQRTLLNQSPPYRQQGGLHGRSDLSMLQQQNAILKQKCKKVLELQEKVEMVLRQNSQLLSQNQKMSRLLHQQKSENQILRNKMQSLAVQKSSFVNQYQIERKKLFNQLERLGEDLAEVQLKKNSQINELKNAYQIELQTLKRQLQTNQHSFQTQLRKYRDQLQKRDVEISDYVNKLKRLSTQSDYQILKLREQKEKLRSQISFIQSDRVKQLQNLKGKLQNNYFEQLQALKRAHLSALQQAEIQNSKLRDSLDERGRYLDQLNAKYNKQRACLEDNLNYLKRDNEMLRTKVLQTQKVGQYEMGNLKSRLSNLHESQVQQLLAKHQSQINILQDEINRLQQITHSKNYQIEQLIKEKVTSRSIFDSEIGRVKQQWNLMFQKHKQLQAKFSDISNQSTLRLQDRQKHILYLEQILNEHKNTAQAEQAALQKSIQILRNDLNSQRMMFREKQQQQKQEVAALKHEIAELQLDSEQRINELKKEINKLKDELSGTSNHLTSKAEGLHSKNKSLQKENQALKNHISIKQKQAKALSQRLKAASDRQTRLESQIDDLRNKIIKNQQKSNEIVNDQKGRLESTYSIAMDSLKADHQAALRLQQNKYRDLLEKLKRKENQLEDLLRKYKRMTDQIQTLTEQQASKKDMTLKYPGATAELIATKNLFDIYLKTKVLDVCGDALREGPRSS